MSTNMASTVVSFDCTAKIYIEGRYSKEHSCHVSLETSNSETYLYIEGHGVRARRIKLTAANMEKIASSRIEEGRLTIVFRDYELNQIALSNVRNKQDLWRCCNILDKITSLPFHTQAVMGTCTTPPNSLRQLSQSMSGSAKRKPQLNLGNSRGSQMVAAATGGRVGASTSGFYKSCGTPTAAPFLPPSSPRTYFTSAKRNLALDLENQQQKEADDFQGSPNVKQPLSQQRFPLKDLSEQKGSSLKIIPADKGEDLEGFANLGNTCYMNAVLQSLLGLDPFAEDLLNNRLVKSVHHESLCRMMFLLLKSKRAKDSYESQRVLLKKIKGVISSRAAKFSGYRQQDAHELLSQCLDQLKDDTDTISAVSEENSDTKDQESLSPVIRSFECEILHIITCKSCDMVTQKTEKIYDFALQLPKGVLLNPTKQANLQQLFDLYYDTEDVEYVCTSCRGKSARLSHQLARLPRVLILHLKRYGYNSQLSKNSKRVDHIRIPRLINVDHLCSGDVGPPYEFRGPWPRDRHILSTMVSGGDDKENIPSDRLHTTPPPLPPNHRKSPEDCASPTVGIPSHNTLGYPTKSSERVPRDSIVAHDGDAPNISTTEQSQPVDYPSSNSLTVASQETGSVVGSHESTCNGEDRGQRETVLGKRRSSERTQDTHQNLQFCCKEPFDMEANVRKVTRIENSSLCSSAVSTTNGANAEEKKVSQSDEIAQEFDSIFASPEVLFEFDNPESITKQEAVDQESSRVNSHSQAQCSLSNGYQSESAGISSVQEEEDLQRAMEESLKAQPNELQMLQQMGLSEEEQLRLAMELSIQESSPEEAPLLSPSTPLESGLTQTPTPEKSNQVYRLMSIVSHIGRGSSGGHYISDVYSVKEGVWKMYNDSQVTEMKEEDVRQKRQTSGYIFFYMHKSTFNSVAKFSKR